MDPKYEAKMSQKRPPGLLTHLECNVTHTNRDGRFERHSSEQLAIINSIQTTPSMLNFLYDPDWPIRDISCYEIQCKIGQGAFGEVFKASCCVTGKFVAVKRVMMNDMTEGLSMTALREVKALKNLKHKHVIELIEVCSDKNAWDEGKYPLYYVFTLCEHDLAGLISAQSVRFTLVHIKTLIKHLFEGLHYIHCQMIMHRDVKPANLLITKDGILKLADFGLSRTELTKIPGQAEPCYTNHVVTLWYRPPELLLGEQNYDSSIDMWGVGCIMAEMWTRTPLMQGRDEQEQLDMISDLAGSINPISWHGVEQLPLYEKAFLPQKLNRKVHTCLIVHVKDRNAMTIIDSLLTLDPRKRLTAEQALNQTFFFVDPKPADNVRDLVDSITKNLFEYTTHCAAHAGRRLNMQLHRGSQRTRRYYRR